jgi:hypothetical protein
MKLEKEEKIKGRETRHSPVLFVVELNFAALRGSGAG